MTTRSLKLATLISAGLALGASSALALDGKVVLDQLVKKGVLTAEEADAIIKKDTEKKLAEPTPAVATGKEITTKKFTISGKVQVQAKVIESDNRANRAGNPKDTTSSGFEIRRADIAVQGEIADSWTACVDYRMETAKNTADANVQFDKAWVEYDTKGYGQILAGLKKAPFGYEEVTSSSYLLTIERGIVNNYFSGNAIVTGTGSANGTDLCLGERRIGLYYDTDRTAKIEKEGGTKFGVAITNDVRRRFDGGSGDLAYYANALHVEKLNDTTFIDVGVNTTYTGSEQQRKLTTGPESTGIQSYGVEAYTRLRLNNFTLLLDGYQAAIENGRRESATRAETAAPMGVMVMASYLIDNTFEPVVAFNYLDTDGRGVQPGDVIRDASNFGVADRAKSIYTGMNWYLTPSKSLKLSAGAEFTRFEGHEQSSTDSVKTDVVGGRMQIQALF